MTAMFDEDNFNDEDWFEIQIVFFLLVFISFMAALGFGVYAVLEELGK